MFNLRFQHGGSVFDICDGALFNPIQTLHVPSKPFKQHRSILPQRVVVYLDVFKESNMFKF